jgi:hypothetical protein
MYNTYHLYIGVGCVAMAWVAAITCHLQRWSFMYNPYPLYQGGLCSYGLGSGYNMPSTKVVFYVQPLPAISGWAV